MAQKKGKPRAGGAGAPAGERPGKRAVSQKGGRGVAPHAAPRAAERANARPAASPGLYIEGRRAVAEALRAGFPVRRALVAEGQRDPGTAEYLAAFKAAGIPVQTVTRDRLDAVSSHGAHQGLALEVGAFPYADLADIVRRAGTGPALVVVLDHVTDEGNLGAIVRSAEVVGAAGVVVAGKRAAGVGVGTFKTSAGAVLHLPIARVTNVARALGELKEAGFWVGGATEHADDVCWDAPLDGRLALVMGSEGEGLSRLVREKCDFLTKLPQRGLTESLNVAQAATVLCYEWMRRTWDALPAAPSAGA